MRLKHWLFLWAVVAAVIVAGVIGQSLKADRLESDSGTIPPISIEKVNR